MFTKAKEVHEFVLAGKATVTLESEKTGVHFTYRVSQAEDRDGKPAQRWFVGVLNGPDNETNYAYIGLLDTGAKRAGMYAPDGPVHFRQTAKSKIGPEAPSVRGFVYFWNAICADKMPGCMKVRHEGRCGRCGHKLTTPESLDRGIGPECAGKMGMDVSPRREGGNSSNAEPFDFEMPPRKAGNNIVAAFANSLREVGL